MPSPKNVPKGYFQYLLAIDCETTGLTVNNRDPSVGHQPISWGIIVADSKTLKPVEELYVEIKWNKQSKSARDADASFGKEAERIHGLTYQYLEENGISEEDAVVMIGELILKYWGPENNIRTLGHNVHLFDLQFLRSMFERYGIRLKFGNRHMDSNSLAFGTVGSFNSDDLFKTLGFEQRTKHNALDDAKMSLESFRLIKLIWNKKVGINAYDNV